MVAWERLGFLLLLWRRRKLGFWVHFVFGLWFGFLVLKPVEGLRPLRERARARSWGDEWLFVRKDENELGPYSEWNITGTYRGTWKFLDSTNSSSRFRDFRKSNGNSITELVSTPTKINGVHYVQGVIIFHDVFDNEHNVGGAQIRVEEGDHDRYHIEGLMESPAVDDDGDCFSPLLLNATSVNIEVYYNKAVNYTLMVTFGAAKVSILMIGQQAIMDAYLCLLHLTAGILVESLFNAFATAAFFKFVVFSIFEMRYLLAIWKASRPMNNGEGWETMRRELSVLYSRFCISVTRLAIPLYIFGCPHNFMRIEPDKNWCICLCVFIGLQASILLLQHYLGSRWFIPRQILPEKYSYYRRFDQGTYHTTDCVICMTAIDLMQRSNDCMVTPCDHFFHSGCLQRWMDIKMECPTCRRPLPPA
ncbi:transmembrane E3 ubiquitin-protein ligase FLY2 [Citrus sinensis]|uniref:Transmembrane E3 ubiquitin-protein ligase FLY2 n=1 Tax=Citrus sinensis TaxID=2711 RepID=A0ACB8N466_CITSI|nr:transmembrane E3 ubiquitin-protein ligase FLY2 [Citrus sinensis]